jgi:tetratricopeptide (TPR) repeat protein
MNTTRKSAVRKLNKLQAAAQRARTAYQWVEAITHYTKALQLPDLSPQAEYELRDGRAYAHQRLGQFQAELADLEKMVELAGGEPAGDSHLKALVSQANALAILGKVEQARSLGEQVLATAEKSGMPYFIGQAYTIFGALNWTSRHYSPMMEAYAAALEIFRQQQALAEEAWCAFNLARAAFHTGQDGNQYAQRVLEIARKLDHRLLEARAYHALSLGVRSTCLCS